MFFFTVLTSVTFAAQDIDCQF